MTTSLSEALAADRAGDIESAAATYEDVLAADSSSLEVLLNLAVLYWQATDVGLAAAKKLSPAFIATAGRRFPILLEEATYRFPESTEVWFWSRYIARADLGEELDADDCKQWLRGDPEVLVPAMHLFAISQGKEAVRDATELLRQCRHERTTRARYIISVIEGVITRAGHQP